MNSLRTKIIGVFSALTAAVMLCGCEPGGSPPQQGSETSSAGEDTKNVYRYEHELNVIDDNYRNYYEIFVYSFCDSDGDGIGDLNGVASKLDYIKDMGFNGIWLMPVMPSESYHKYNVKDYYDIDPQYGTMADFENLAKECKARGIKLIIDMVMNHTSCSHEWFSSAVKSLNQEPCGADKDAACLSETPCPDHNPYVDYYFFSKEKKNNTYKVGDYYYEAVFSDDMPEIDLENESVRRDFEEIAKFWLEKGVGGFRLDAVKEYVSGNSGKNIEILKWFVDYCKSVDPDCYIIGEVWLDFTAYTQYYESGIDSVFGFNSAQATGRIAKTLNMFGSANSVTMFAKSMVTTEERIAQFSESAIDAPFIGNHDTARGAGIFGYDPVKLKAAAGLQLTMTGSPFVYYGEEIALTGKGRDENKRAPMIWDTKGTGVTNGPKDMEPQENKFASVEEQLADPNSILNYYKRATRIRNENPCIARGKTELIDIEDENIAAVRRTWNDDSIVIVYNFSDEEKTLTGELPDIDSFEIRGYLTVDSGQAVTLDTGLTMPSFSIAFLTDKK